MEVVNEYAISCVMYVEAKLLKAGIKTINRANNMRFDFLIFYNYITEIRFQRDHKRQVKLFLLLILKAIVCNTILYSIPTFRHF